jgi:hypothetical protein
MGGVGGGIRKDSPYPDCAAGNCQTPRKTLRKPAKSIGKGISSP